MSFPRYPAYKDSGVNLLPAGPAHWKLKRFKRIFREREARSEQGMETLLSVSAYTGVKPRSEMIVEGEHLSRAESLEGYKICFENDLVMNIMLAWNRGLAFTQYDGIVSPAYCVFSVIDGSEPRFLNYLVRSDDYTLYFKAYSSGVMDSRLRIYPDTFGSLFCALPPLNEQIQIAAFLDRETAKIDALVAEQRRLMDLLKEKRQAVISLAVTRGLNPDVPTKPSGLEWLGNVPSHWGVVSLKRFCDVRDGTHDTPEFIDWSESSFPFVTSKDLVSGHVCLDETKHISEIAYHEIARRSGVARGDVLMPMIGSIGGAVLVATDVRFAIKNIALFKASTGHSARWLQLLLDSDLSVLQFELNRSGGVQGFVALGTLRNLIFPFPPLEEQHAIATHLNKCLGELDTLTAEAQRAIDLLQERRTALISAAVTGQIDVREFAEKDPQ